LTHNDETAIGVIGALREAGLQVPEDVSVAGFDGLEIGAYFSPSLTTVEVPLHNIGARAATLLLDQIEKFPASSGVAPDTIPSVLPCELQARESTAPPATVPPAKKTRVVSKRRA
jgi:DNA-binding LacI/PurR family transcriptional regulator